MRKIDSIFHKATQFGEHLKDTVVNDVKKVGHFLEKNFVEPSINVAKIKDAKLNDMKRKADRGEYNQ